MSRLGFVVALLTGCLKDTYEPPSSVCPCDQDFSTHPHAGDLQAVVDARVAGGLPGLSVAVRTPDGVWAGAAGSANLEDAIPMNVCHLHHFASIAKTYYATLALRLQELGLLDLDDRLAEHLAADVIDGIPNADIVTLRQLMNHTSGIPDFNSDLGYITGELNYPTEENTPYDLVDEMRGGKPLGAPGEVYSYTDGNYVLLALVIEAVTGDHVASLYDELFDPLGLSATAVYVRGQPEPDCVCNTYWEVGGQRLENVSDDSAEYAIHDIGADGIAASPLDGLTFVEALVRGDLLTEESRAEMRTWAPPSEGEDGYAYGLGIAKRDTVTGVMVGHTGGGVGTGSVLRASPDEDITFVAATNAGMFLPGDLTEQWNEELWDDLAEAAGLVAR
jgi:D-alanyl-D-alanine carboxypeptidase